MKLTSKNNFLQSLSKGAYVVLLLICFILFSCINNQNFPEEVLKEYFVSVNSCNYERAQELSVGEAFDAVKYDMKDSCEVIEVEIVSVSCKTEGNKATCDIKIKRDVGSTAKETYTYSLVQKDGEWKIADLPEGFILSKE